MTKLKIIGKNITALTISNIISKIANFLFFIIIARYLGSKSYGVLSTAVAFTGLFSVLMDLGLKKLTIREVAKEKNKTINYTKNILGIKLLLVLITLIFITISANFLNFSKGALHTIYIMGIYQGIRSFNRFFYSVYQAHEEMEFFAIGTIFYSLLRIGGALILIFLGYNLTSIALLYVGASLIILNYNICLFKSKFQLVLPKLNLGFLKSKLAVAIPFGVSGIMIKIYYDIDKVMLSQLVANPNQVVGWYNAAYKITSGLIFIPIVFSQVLFPVLSKKIHNDEKKVSKILELFFKIMVVLGIPIGAGITTLAHRFVPLILGDNYSQSILPLKILIWATILIYIHAPFDRILEAGGWQKIFMKIMILGAIINILLNSVLIHTLGFIGASVATVLTEFSILTGEYYFSSKKGYKITKERLKIFPKICIACGGMLIFLFAFSNSQILLLVSGSTMIYFVILYIVKGFTQKEINLLKKFIFK